MFFLTQLDDEKKTTIRMNITYPNHAVNKMFCKPPLLKQFEKKNENKLIPKIESPIVETYIYGMILLQRIIL